MAQPRPYCLTIAGFDPSGGAGIIADCKTFEQLKVQGLSVITANTIQTEDQFVTTDWIPVEIIEQQLIVLLERYPVKHFKIGLIENGTVLLRILDVIHEYCKHPFILWDPVLQPSAGGELSDSRFNNELPAILERIRRITPNLPEYRQLLGDNQPGNISNQQLSIYLKGGHANPPGRDLLYTKGKIYPFNAQGIFSGKHGTGCILSAAQLAYTARNFPVVKSGLLAKRYLEACLRSNESLLSYHSR